MYFHRNRSRNSGNGEEGVHGFSGCREKTDKKTGEEGRRYHGSVTRVFVFEDDERNDVERCYRAREVEEGGR